MSAKDGGPAFPHVHGIPVPPEKMETIEKCEVVYHGLSLRDYFAAAAMIGLIQRVDTRKDEKEKLGPAAYTIADLLLAEREKQS